MDKILAIFCFLIALAIMFLTFPEGLVAILVTVILSALTIVLIRQNTEESKFLIRIFLVALILRVLFGTFLHVFNLREYFGSDALNYDWMGQRLVDIWFHDASANDWFSQKAISTSTPGWGLTYLTGFLYTIFGQNILAAQFFCAVFGAATAPMVYVCAHKIFHNNRVGKIAALMVALFPAFIIWSSQLLKDGLIIFLLVLAMTMVLHLQERFSYLAVAILIFSLFGILSLRFYIFYMVAISVAGSFVIGQSGSFKSIVRGVVALVILGLALTYLGVFKTAEENFDKFGSLEKVQQSRNDLQRSADSGFGGDENVSTTEGAISAIPIGFSYLMFAPFPWQLGSLRQAVTLPEMLVWWSSIPLLIIGLLYTIKNRLRGAIAILIFTLMLTIAYSIFQGNVGTAYRQRTQIQVFLFIFIAVGWTLRQEKKENRKNQKLEKQKRLDKYLRESRAIGSAPTTVK
ncbi:MAG: glycosyltransferase family 39 protein [Actinomycetota bacterium]